MIHFDPSPQCSAGEFHHGARRRARCSTGSSPTLLFKVIIGRAVSNFSSSHPPPPPLAVFVSGVMLVEFLDLGQFITVSLSVVRVGCFLLWSVGVIRVFALGGVLPSWVRVFVSVGAEACAMRPGAMSDS